MFGVELGNVMSEAWDAGCNARIIYQP